MRSSRDCRSVWVDELTFAPDGKINTVTPPKTGPVPPAPAR